VTDLLQLIVPGVAPGQSPEVHLIDARNEKLDQVGLKARARRACETSQAPFTSRSYRFPLALVACHYARVGVDVERVESCDKDFADSIRTPTELAGGSPAVDSDRFFTSLWSSKEALSKALGDALDYDPRRLEGPGAWPDGRAGPWRARALEVSADHVAWLCWHTAEI
jgi:4'-phosphopantetheinyl transferase superfamily